MDISKKMNVVSIDTEILEQEFEQLQMFVERSIQNGTSSA